jgi:hypothetical protein
MRHMEPNRTVFLPWFLLAAGWALLCVFAPWRQVHPSNVALVLSLARAPLWTHDYDGLPGAQLDISELFVEATLILVVCGLLLAAVRSPKFRTGE